MFLREVHPRGSRTQCLGYSIGYNGSSPHLLPCEEAAVLYVGLGPRPKQVPRGLEAQACRQLLPLFTPEASANNIYLKVRCGLALVRWR